MKTRKFASLLAGVAALAISSASLAAVEVGQKAPEFSGVSTEGKEISLDDFKNAKAVVVAFTCNQCPVAVAYEDRFVEFTQQYKDKGVEFVAINVNPESIDAMKTRAEEKGLNYPYIKDESGKSAQEYGATVTPHLFVLGPDRKVAYIGAFDNDMQKPDQTYLADAVDAVLAGKKPATESTKAFGCGIKISKSSAK